jgi:hypothetical protein
MSGDDVSVDLVLKIGGNLLCKVVGPREGLVTIWAHIRSFLCMGTNVSRTMGVSKRQPKSREKVHTSSDARDA